MSNFLLKKQAPPTMPTRQAAAAVPFKERRKHFRVVPPVHLIKEFALWFRPPAQSAILPLAALMAPDLSCVNNSTNTTIANISAGGLCFLFDRKDLHNAERLRHRHAFVYLKLRRPLPGKYDQYILFFGATLLHAAAEGEQVRVRCQIVSRGMPSASSKEFQMLNVEQEGLRDLSVWCNEINRMGHGIVPSATPGLDIEYLLMELANIAREQAAAAAAAPAAPAAPARPNLLHR